MLFTLDALRPLKDAQAMFRLLGKMGMLGPRNSLDIFWSVEHAVAIFSREVGIFDFR
ncbi:protein of unknown function [Candidatus Filomicrobium marinum]|uniref:Uncharacterized protein n=1 Tax=Candidatus Filomicrobium marinum TaxID=1608628 RepID=A0A0D6JBN3_9HYPH|nr:protein of unknown function [Candidatus Filomicrobium marinum]CPR15611.1 protein of unknown function [Candidatus Filomicrobium marinum]